MNPSIFRKILLIILYCLKAGSLVQILWPCWGQVSIASNKKKNYNRNPDYFAFILMFIIPLLNIILKKLNKLDKLRKYLMILY